jgi:hypothetical protein
MLRGVVSTIVTVVWLTILVLVGGRFLALLGGANRESEIVDRLYRHSDFWVKPFFGMLDLSNKTVDSTGGVFEPASFIAFIVYLLVGLLIMAILTASSRPLWGRHTHAIDAP